MTKVNALNNPKISDTIVFDLETTDTDGNLVDPYKVNKIILYYLERDFVNGNFIQFDKTIDDDKTITTFFNTADVVKTFGNAECPAWLSTDIDAAFIARTDVGKFELEWQPKSREGDYIVCWTWTHLPAGDTASNYFSFEINGNTQQTTVIPTHFTRPGKYEEILERYLPETFKIRLGDGDLTPETMDKLNKSVGDGFTVLEDLANQMVDLIDANVVTESYLPFLANLFNLSLKSNDVTLWRRQIKAAIPLYKKKGTLPGLIEAMEQAGIVMHKFTRLYQIVSPYTWCETFTVEDDDSWELDNLAILSPFDNFEIQFRAVDTDEFIDLTTDYVSFDNNEVSCVTTVTWVGDALSFNPIILENGDTIKVLYKISDPVDQSTEDYIRELPLADQREDRNISPRKNWNVRVIAEDDPMLDVLCPKREPFRDPVIFGHIRTEFPYSENVYNMDSYNGSTRPSTNPCDVDREFVDDCSCCLGSYYNVDLEIEELSNDRIEEARDVLKRFVPFHAIPHSINLTGAVNEFLIPPLEEVEALVNIKGNEFCMVGQNVFNRVREDGDTTKQIKRDALAEAETLVVANGTASNNEVVLYSPDVRFDLNILGTIDEFNLLEILSGPNTGNYKATNPNRLSIGVKQGDPDTIGSPLNTSSFPFRLSNRLFSGSVDSIEQDDVFKFTDANVRLRDAGVLPGWKITVTAPLSVVGTYVIDRSFPDDSLNLIGWPITTNLTGITYQLKTDTDVAVGSVSATGSTVVSRRGKVNASSDIKSRYVLKEGDYLLIGSTQYRILEWSAGDTFFIDGYTGGNVGITSVKVLRRLLEDKVGYLMHKGLTLDTPVNHEVGLGISNGVNGTSDLLEDNLFKQNHLILIDGNYYQMVEIDGTIITLSGPFQDWQLSGTSVQYTIIRFNKTSPMVVDGTEFQRIDRRNNEIITYNIQTAVPMAARMAALNSPNGILDTQQMGESISMQIEWRD